MLTVYFENRAIFFAAAAEIPSGVGQDYIVSGEDSQLLSALPFIFVQQPDIECLYVSTDDAEAAFAAFSSNLNIIDAAGGLVRDDEGRYLLIHRRGVWDLPKGKLEKGESLVECAVREVAEETGVEPLEAGELICVTHHTYILDDKLTLKNSYWYTMIHHGDVQPVPQTEEEIAQAVWMSPAEVAEACSTSYNSIREVLHTAGL